MKSPPQVVYYDRLLPSQRWSSGRGSGGVARGLPAVLAHLDALGSKEAGLVLSFVASHDASSASDG